MTRRSGLGKGLSALIPTTDSPSDAELRDLPVGLISANAYQPRSEFDDEAIDALTASITELGVLQPVLVRPVGDHFELVAGERRWRAAQAAGLATIPAIVRKVDDHDSLAQALVENLQREDLSAIEEAVAYQQLVDEFGLTPEQVGERVSKSRSAVANTLRLLQLPPDLQAMVRSGELSAGHGRALLAVADAEQQAALAQQIVTQDLSVRATEDAVRRLPDPDAEPAPRPAEPAKSASVLELEEQLGERLATRVQVQVRGRGRGRIVIEFAGTDDLNRLYQTLLDGPESSL